MGNGMAYRLPMMLIILFPLVGCETENKNETATEQALQSSFATQYPVLAEHFDMNESDFNIYLNASGKGTPITATSIKSMNVGYPVNTLDSTYHPISIFDLGSLGDRLYIEQQQGKEKSSFELSSKASNHSVSSQHTIDASASVRYGGLKVAGSTHHALAYLDASSTGDISAIMTRENVGKSIQILPDNFNGYENFERYLRGTELTSEQLKKKIQTIVDMPTEGQCDQKPYFKEVKIDTKPWSDDAMNPYGDIQILSEMEDVFAQLQTQYGLCADTKIREVLVKNMKELRGHIIASIQHFYSQYGDSFVSKVNVINRARGIGQLNWGKTTKNRERQHGGTASISYSALTWGGNASGSYQYHVRNADAKAFKNITVNVEAEPDNSINTTEWQSNLTNMLNSMAEQQNDSVQIPAMSTLPTQVELKLPEPTEPRKKLTPPDSVFKDLAEWKAYYGADESQAKHLMNSGLQQSTIAKMAEEAYLETEQVAINTLMKANNSVEMDQKFQQELAKLNDVRQNNIKPPLLQNNSNQILIPGTFTSSFETLSYDEVIPQLRPKLNIPGEQARTLADFPNLVNLLMRLEKLGRLDSYLNFLSGISVSGVSVEMKDKFHTFYQAATDSAYSTILIAIQQGVDIPNEIFNDWVLKELGTEQQMTQSKLYKALNTPEYYKYVMALLDPAYGKVWSKGSGGYMPMRTNDKGYPELMTWKDISANYQVVQSVVYDDNGMNPLRLYTNTPMQTPWYPVYIYNKGQVPTLVFVQMFGVYQVIYGREWVVQPTHKWLGTVDKNHKNGVYESKVKNIVPSITPLWEFWVNNNDDKQDRYQVLNNEMKEAITSTSNSFLYNDRDLNWDYSLKFADLAMNDEQLLNKFNVLLIYLDEFANPQSEKLGLHSVANPSYKKHANDGYAEFRANNIKVISKKTILSRNGNTLMLLPLNAENTDGKLAQVVDYAPERNPLDIVNRNTMETLKKLALLNVYQ